MKALRTYDNGRPFDEVVDNAIEVIDHGINERPDFDIDSFTDYSRMKEKLAKEVVSAETNKDMLENVPHKKLEDMAVVYRFVLESSDEGRASILVTNQIFQQRGRRITDTRSGTRSRSRYLGSDQPHGRLR